MNPIVPIAGGMMLCCLSSSVTSFMMGGEEKEDPVVPGTTAGDDTGDDDSGADDTGDDDSGADDSGGGGGEEESDTSAVEYHWTTHTFKKFEGGKDIKTIRNASARKCRKKCEKKNKCVGFSIVPIIGTKTCILYSGDVRTEYDMNKNTHLLSRV